MTFQSVQEMHEEAADNQRFEKYLCIGYSVSSASMDKRGYHPVCVAGTQFKLVSMGEDEEEDEEVDEEEKQPVAAPASRDILGAARDRHMHMQSLLLAGVTRQAGAVSKSWSALANNFPDKFSRSVGRLTRGCVRTSGLIVKVWTQVWRDLWR